MVENTVNEKIIEKSKELKKQIENDIKTEIKGIITEEDYSEIYNRCCENILGYKKIPLGISNRKVKINNNSYYIPIATTEGALVASMCRGIKLINECGGVKGYVENLGITRSFTIKFKSFEEAIEFYKWIKLVESTKDLIDHGNMNSKYLRIRKIESKHVFGDEVYIKVYAFSGDAMGMNMITKACNQISKRIMELFPGSSLVCISSNICTDKKWSIENYCNGRGKKVFLNIKVGPEMCKKILKVTTDEIYAVYHTKIVVGSTLVLGGANCQAANYVAAVFLALGQDLGHVVDSSNCVLTMKKTEDGSLNISLFMPSIIVGVIGGGTHLEPSKSFLSQFSNGDSSCLISDFENDSEAPSNLALTVASAVLAGELSVMASLSDNSLMNAHLNLNRKQV